MTARERRGLPRRLDVMVEFVREEHRTGGGRADQAAGLRGGEKPVERLERGPEQPNFGRVAAVFRMPQQRASPGLLVGLDDPDPQPARDPVRSDAGMVRGERPAHRGAVVQRRGDERAPGGRGQTRPDRVTGQHLQAEVSGPCPGEAEDFRRQPHARCPPGMLIIATAASGASPSNSPSATASAWSSATTPERSTTRAPTITNMSGAITLSPL